MSAFVVLATGTLPTAAQQQPADAFEPAFTADSVAYDACRTLRNGVATNADPAAIRRVLGFHAPDANCEDLRWEGGQVTDASQTVFEYMVVLKESVPVGAVCVDPADEGYKGSKNNGELFLLKDGISGAPDPSNSSQWVAVAFPPAQPMTRFATLPAGSKTRAMLYRDIRVDGLSRVEHWRFFRQRLHNVTPAGLSSGSGGHKGSDPDGLVRGQGWGTGVGGQGGAISAKDPAWCVVSWEQPQTLTALFLRSNAKTFEVESLSPKETGDAATAPESSWKKLPLAAEHTARHDYRYWACSFRWLSLPPTVTRAVRVKLTSMENGGKEVWVNGIGVFVDLQSAPVPAVAVRDEQPPFRIKYDVPADGQMALALDDASGHRLKNVLAEVERPAGPAEEPWDLKDAAGAYVAPGTYRLKGIVGPAVQLRYEMTPYPNVDQLWPDRTPWLQGHSGPHGWLSDHSQNQAAAALGDHVYFGASMAEAGVCFIECDKTGRKLWGQNNFGAWLGVYMLAADDQAVYIAASDGSVYRMDPATHQSRKLFHAELNRSGWLSSMAAHAGKVYLAFNGGGSTTSIDNATAANNVVLEHSLVAGASSSGFWSGFVRALRLEGHPPGQNGGLVDLATDTGKRRNQYILLAFREPVPLGSIAFPHPGGAYAISFSVLAPNAPYPPRPDEAKDWIPFESNGQTGVWNCIAAPPGTLTRALKVTFVNKVFSDMDDSLAEASTSKAGRKPSIDDDLAGLAAADRGQTKVASKEGEWAGRLDGLKLIRRRFVSLSSTTKVRVNSGAVKPGGEWEAARTEPIGEESPGIYLMEWDTPQKVSGLAIKEIDGARTEIDVWQGPVSGQVPIDGPVLAEHSGATGWRRVATYRQERRSAYNPSADCNPFAKYIDGYVDFREVCETRAVRLRIVEPWLDNGDKNAECRRATEWAHGVHYKDQPCAKLDTLQCHVYGVAPLQYLGGEAPLQAQAGDRLEVYDGQTGALVKQLPSAIGWHGLSFGPKGDLYAIEKGHQDVVRVDLESGHLTPVVTKCEPSVMTVGPDGLIYVFPWTDNSRAAIQVYDAAGKQLRTIGRPGGRSVGPWDPQRFKDVVNLTVDASGNVWVVECGNYPRRIVNYRTDGAFVKEILGNTMYGGGGGGVLDRFDATRAWYGAVEFELDRTQHTSRVAALIGEGIENDLVPMRVAGREETFMVSTPLTEQSRQSYGVVYVYDKVAHTVRRVAAVGDASFFAPLRKSKVMALLKGGVPKGFSFLWSDRNGNGDVDPDEVDFKPKAKVSAFESVGPFDSALGCVGGGIRYKVKEFLPGGVPVYERLPLPGPALVRLDDGNYFSLHTPFTEDGPIENFVMTAKGEKVWGYPTGQGGVGGLSVAAWSPGRVCNQFAVIGHETAPQGDLGEFVVVHANSGEWNVWTADGLLAGQILLDKSNPRSKLFGPPVVTPGMRLDPLTASQEHFHGFFTRTEADNRYHIIAGFTHMSIIEVQGLEKYRRFATDVTVTPADLQKDRAWETAQVRRQIQGRALLVKAPSVETPPVIDGDGSPHEWPGAVSIDDSGSATFAVSYDRAKLYLCWKGKGLGPIRNGGTEFQRYFKTGAALDFLLGADPKADTKRERPVRGDLRLLITFVGGVPKAVVYQSVAPGALAGEGWKTRTEAGGETAFDRVVELKGATVRMGGEQDWTVEAAIPLGELGVKIEPGARVKMDWGVLTSPDGNQVKQRMYWANKAATGTSDEAIEARLEPSLWGTLIWGAGSVEDDLESIAPKRTAPPEL